MLGYEVVNSWNPFYSDSCEKRMNEELLEYGIDPLWLYDEYFQDKLYYTEFVSSGHERDSSGDQIVLWKRKGDIDRDVIDLRKR